MDKAKKFGLSAGVSAGISWFGYHCGAGFATGRQMVQYTTRHGWAGAWIPILIWIIMGFVSYICIEYAYLTRSKTYKEFNLGFYNPVGRISLFLWDFIVLIGVFVGMGSVMATAGKLFQTVLGVSYGVGVAIFTVMLLVCVVWGYEIISKVGSIITIPMIALMFLIIFMCISYNFDNLKLVMSDTSLVEGDSIFAMVKDGVTYAGNMASFLPAFIAMSYAFTKESDTKAGALTGAGLNCLMQLAMCVLVYSAYPWANKQELVVLSIINETPWPFLAAVYQLVIFLALLSTGVTMIYGSMSRYSVYGKKFLPNETIRKTCWATVFTLGSIAVSSLGLTAVVNYGYKITGTLRIPVILIPVLVLGPWRIHQAKAKKKAAEEAAQA